MTSMKEYVEEMTALIDKNQELPVKMTEEMEVRVQLRVCPFCGFAEIMMCREFKNPLIIEHSHCQGCGENWTTVWNQEEEGVLLYKTQECWLDSVLLKR